ncbi:hypothetical protein HPB50_002945 [Hyalomma asiaticum]|uniref:Uncharacterized protein n=1 Tax=Hyalomma asiaticum TaxID=266040 RepID=A0ACB7T7M9_HYAAI|nr:hypothetical protein HPB50_002945 [Hyalomma asiaticum]
MGGDRSPSAAPSPAPGTSYAQAAKKPRGARKPAGHPGNQRACPGQHHGQELADMRLLLGAVGQLLPPDNQPRSICLRAGGRCPPPNHHV